MADQSFVGESVLCHVPGLASEITVWGDPADTGIFGSIHHTGHYEPHVMLALQRLLPADAICIDGGANIGVLSLAMALYAPKGKVFSFEPGENNFSYLEANIEANGSSTVEPIRAGLWDSTGVLQLNVEEGHQGGAFVGESVNNFTTAESIDATTVDHFVEKMGLTRIDLIKLDIEGAEPWALAGAEETIRRFGPALLIEFNPVALRLFHDYDCWKLFDELGRLFGAIAAIRSDGSTVRLRSKRLANRMLIEGGLLDLVCLPHRPAGVPAMREHARMFRKELALTAKFNRFRPSPRAFLYMPEYNPRFLINELRLPAGSVTTVPVRLVNTGDVWLNSDYPDHPITAAYRWLSVDGSTLERDGPRTLFDRPVRPGRHIVIDLHVEAPTTPGNYLLAFSLVQERFAWCDDLRPASGTRIPVTVI